MDPIDRVHFLNERALANDGADKVQAKYGGIIPVARHHSSDCYSFVLHEYGVECAICSFDSGFVFESVLKHIANAFQRD